LRWAALFVVALAAVQCSSKSGTDTPQISQAQRNEAATAGNLRAICAAQIAFHAANGRYAVSFDQLLNATPPLLTGDWSQPRDGYVFTMGGSGQDFACTANPEIQGETGERNFFADSTTEIRYELGAVATAASRPLGT